MAPGELRAPLRLAGLAGLAVLGWRGAGGGSRFAGTSGSAGDAGRSGGLLAGLVGVAAMAAPMRAGVRAEPGVMLGCWPVRVAPVGLLVTASEPALVGRLAPAAMVVCCSRSVKFS
ncbi:hypothetical protein [Mycobacterium spongiae]|uniref:Uncharacterized protein n=1 Tax=Mycobacterium spongiae TaxID=886343 RepID=A0A975PW24_9MYCO|nr:hypothetical protein [Mycobacterium spongiae]QUR66344.1 hypothetical protein F6B93_03900 [Mycobacterium spongiae]